MTVSEGRRVRSEVFHHNCACKRADMSSALLSQALCGELSASRLQVIRRPLTSLLHFVPHQLRTVRRDVSSRRCSLCTAAASSPAAVVAPVLEDTSPHQSLQPRDHEWPGLAAWRASGIDDRRHWGLKGPVVQVSQRSKPACSLGMTQHCRRPLRSVHCQWDADEHNLCRQDAGSYADPQCRSLADGAVQARCFHSLARHPRLALPMSGQFGGHEASRSCGLLYSRHLAITSGLPISSLSAGAQHRRCRPEGSARTRRLEELCRDGSGRRHGGAARQAIATREA